MTPNDDRHAEGPAQDPHAGAAAGGARVASGVRSPTRRGRGARYEHEHHGILLGRGERGVMDYAHSHCEIELNVFRGGRSWYRIGGREVEVLPGRLAVFSALTPHELIRRDPGATHDWMDLPMPVVSAWSLPERMMGRIMSGEMLFDADPVRHEEDGPRWARWDADVCSRHPRRLRVALLEARARLERLALELEKTAVKSHRKPAASSDVVVDMMHHLLRHFGRRITLAEVAEAVGLHPNTAATRFRAETGETVMGFLNTHRLQHAKLQLASTELPVPEVAAGSGFGSLSRFYEAFKEDEGAAPAAFRRAAKQEGGPHLESFRDEDAMRYMENREGA